jgi:hypothetical protein
MSAESLMIDEFKAELTDVLVGGFGQSMSEGRRVAQQLVGNITSWRDVESMIQRFKPKHPDLAKLIAEARSDFLETVYEES